MISNTISRTKLALCGCFDVMRLLEKLRIEGKTPARHTRRGKDTPLTWSLNSKASSSSLSLYFMKPFGCKSSGWHFKGIFLRWNIYKVTRVRAGAAAVAFYHRSDIPGPYSFLIRHAAGFFCFANAGKLLRPAQWRPWWARARGGVGWNKSRLPEKETLGGINLCSFREIISSTRTFEPLETLGRIFNSMFTRHITFESLEYDFKREIK